MRVYRVEHRHLRFGPWQHPAHHACDILGRWFPLPSMHYYGPNDKYYRNGCRTLAQLEQWFSNKARQQLHRCGYVVRVYDVPKIEMEDAYQVIFHRPKYKRSIATISLLDIMPKTKSLTPNEQYVLIERQYLKKRKQEGIK